MAERGWQRSWIVFVMVLLDLGGSLRFGLYWLYMAMAFLKALFCEVRLSRGMKTKDL
jgi:hypothetical protein